MDNLQDRIQHLLASPSYRPIRMSEIVSSLKIPVEGRKHVRQVLDRLLQEGVIVRIRKDRIVLPSQADLITGRLQMHERGFGFVSPENFPGSKTSLPDIFIAAEDTGVAMHGDRVVVRIHETGLTSRKRSSSSTTSPPKICGRVIRVLERANSTMIGILQRSQYFHYVIPDDPRLTRDIYVNLSHFPLKARVGDRVVVKLLAWENRHVNPEGILIEIIGRSDDPSLDIFVIVKKFRFRMDFPKEVLVQADTIKEEISDAERKRRIDFTKERIVTIDPEDARDYDDALSLKHLNHGRWLIGVHIADVSHYVHTGSLLDREAYERGNSIYLPDRVIPMLPPRLSNEICSLKPGVERLTQSVLFEINPDASIHSYSFHDSIISSSSRLTYRQVLSVLQSTSKGKEHSSPTTSEIEDPALCQFLKNLWSIASRIRAQRFTHGSLDLDFPQLKVHCNSRGLAVKIEKEENDISHQLVEEFMLLANEAVAMETRRRTIPSIYRIHENPDPEKLEQYRDFVIANGYTMGDPTVRGEIQKFLKRLHGKSEEYILKLSFLRSLKRAQYSINPVGHFGLAKGNYTHFTSPIRRYADLVVHRNLLRATCRFRKPPLIHPKKKILYDVAALENIALHCSTTERLADEAEKEATALKLVEYFERQLKEHQLDTFDAIVTEVRNFGLFVELPEFLLSGLVHVSTLEDDFYYFDPQRQRLIGKRNHRIFRAGNWVKVKVARVDRFKKQVDFHLTE